LVNTLSKNFQPGDNDPNELFEEQVYFKLKLQPNTALFSQANFNKGDIFNICGCFGALTNTTIQIFLYDTQAKTLTQIGT